MIALLVYIGITIFTVWLFVITTKKETTEKQSQVNRDVSSDSKGDQKKEISVEQQSVPKELTESTPNPPVELQSAPEAEDFSFEETSFALPTPTIIYGTQKGTAERFAKELVSEFQSKGWKAPPAVAVEEYDFDQLTSEEMIILIVATYIEGTPTDSTKNFYRLLKGEANDERAGPVLHGINFGVFGLCNSLYSDHYNTVGKNIDKWFMKLGGKRLVRLGEGDENADQDEAFKAWRARLWKILEQKERQLRQTMDPDLQGITSITYSSDEDESNDKEPLMDIEDIGNSVREAPVIKKRKRKHQQQKKSDKSDEEDEESDDDGEDFDPEKPLTEMLSSTHKKSLQKQGYKIIGGHSGVKLCRWTKSMLRGRGGCYKHTFYGIASHQCMEMTPSMACANKCVFCWRHHKNPVTREWRWLTDDPVEIIDGAIERHHKMIKTCRGIPGVVQERFEEGFNVRHCALSLVGEPIIYPEINQFVNYLHSKHISTFMVTNAQFPDKIESLVPVTQLYVSIDAPTEESLKKIDRPLFKDFWQRFIDSIQALSAKGQRTVFRLTLVKDWNMDEMSQYAHLVSLGKPDFIEVKGVTFAGGGKKNQLSMANVPWHTEVIRFCENLGESIRKYSDENQLDLPEYEIASEHEHSCCILLANTQKFKRDGEWYTWIDFDKFIELHSNPDQLRTEDYMAPTPHWAVYGSEERGFDPQETRFRKVRNHPGRNSNAATEAQVSADLADFEESYVGGGC